MGIQGLKKHVQSHGKVAPGNGRNLHTLRRSGGERCLNRMRCLPVPSDVGVCLSLNPLLLEGVKGYLTLLDRGPLGGWWILVTSRGREWGGRTTPVYILREPRRLAEKTDRRNRMLE